jgi:poly(A) polymerase
MERRQLDRRQGELVQIPLEDALMSRRPVPALQELLERGGLEEFPEVVALVGFGGPGQGHKDLWDHTKRVVAQVGRRLDLRWAALFHDVGKPRTVRRSGGQVMFHHHEVVSRRMFVEVARRICLHPGFALHVATLIGGLGHIESYTDAWTDSAVRRAHKELGDEFDDVVLLARGDITTRHAHKRRAHMKRMSELSSRARRLAAEDAVPAELPSGLGRVLAEAFSVVPGPELGRMMSLLRARVNAGELPRGGPPEAYVEYLRTQWDT